MVIRYDFLWKEDEKAGRVEGRKDRPCLILGVWDHQDDDMHNVLICPITHSPPHQNQTAVEIPVRMARHLSLDDDRMWIKTHEVNTVLWLKDSLPVGLVPVKRGQLIFGQMHSKLGAQAYEQVREHVRNRTLENVRREPDPYLQEVLGKKRKSQKSDVKNT